MRRRSYAALALNLCLILTLCLALFAALSFYQVQPAQASAPGPVNATFAQVARESGVPASLLKAICYMEGRLSNHGGSPSVDDGFGCMHLVKNAHSDTLDSAASALKVSVSQLKTDLATNIRGGAAILRADALQLSGNHRLPANLNGWYGAVAQYSAATTRSTALMYANEVYKLLSQGFSAQTESSETVTLTPEEVHPALTTASAVRGLGKGALPAGCRVDKATDYPGAVDCILPASTFDCNKVHDNDPCTYESANRPTDFAIDQIVIHDIEGTTSSALNVFQDVNRQSSVQYIVDTDGTVYQMVHEKDIAYHCGNYWYNQHSIGIEHAGYDVTGYQWYNATEYLASAKLVAYLLNKYQIPLDHAHIISHGTVPSPSATALPNHVDPGPYWLWSYYLKLIHQQGVDYPEAQSASHLLNLHPKSASHLAGANGRETAANFSFFFLYNGPSTRSGKIPQQNMAGDMTDVTTSLEAESSFYYLAKARDNAGSGDTMYKIWYGEENQVHSANSSRFAHAKLAWLALPPGAATGGQGVQVTLAPGSGTDTTLKIYGRPITGKDNILGDAPAGSVFISAYTVTEDGTTNLWYEINYNHRQAWVPASEIAGVDPGPVPTPQPEPPPQLDSQP